MDERLTWGGGPSPSPWLPLPDVALPAPASAEADRIPGWDLLLACVAVYIATAVGRIHELFPILSALKPALLATIIAIALYLLQQRGQRRIALLRSRISDCLIGLLLWAALSVPTALNQGVAFHSWTDLLRTIVMCFVLAGSVRRPRDVERLILVYYVSTVIYTLVVLSRFELGPDNWRLGRLYYYDANDFATLIVTAMPFGLYFVLGKRHLALRLLSLAGLAVMAVAQIRSGSRGGFVALLAVVAFVLLRFTTVPARARMAGLLLILTIAFGAASDQYWTQMQTLIHPKADYNMTSDAGRMRIWKRGLGYMAARPITGVGLYNFQVAEGTISPLAKLGERGRGVRWGAAHNSFIQVGAELGVLGLLLYVAWLANAFASLRRTANRALRSGEPARDVPRLAQTLMASLFGFVVGSFFLSLAYSDMLYTLAGLSLALSKTAKLTAASST
jgi:O-antigen ligase